MYFPASRRFLKRSFDIFRMVERRHFCCRTRAIARIVGRAAPEALEPRRLLSGYTLSRGGQL